jgi:hypothetical protein
VIVLAKNATDGVRSVIDLGTHPIDEEGSLALPVTLTGRVDIASLRYSGQLMAVAEIIRADGQRASAALEPIHFHPSRDQLAVYTDAAKKTDHRAGDFRALHDFEKPARYCEAGTCYERASVEKATVRLADPGAKTGSDAESEDP